MVGQDFEILKDIVQPDSRGRLSIGAVTKGKNYRVMVNEAGQILLDPVVAIPERELWLWQNPERSRQYSGELNKPQGEISMRWVPLLNMLIWS